MIYMIRSFFMKQFKRMKHFKGLKLFKCYYSFKMFDNQKFLNDLYLYCSHRDIKFYELTYTEQLACIRSMLVCITRKQKI